jgi:hypothetical protein
MKKFFMLLLPIFLVGCMGMPNKHTTPNQEGKFIEHTEFTKD